MLQTAFRPSCINRASVLEWHNRFKEGTESVKDDERRGRNKEVNIPELVKELGLGLLCWGFKGVQEEIPWEEARTLQIVSVAFPAGQSTNPQLHPCQTIWARWASKKFLGLPIVQTVLPVTFGYSLSSEAVVKRQLRRWKRLWRRSLTRSHKSTSMGPSRSCWNGSTSALHSKEFHVCTINKSAHTKKVWKLI